MLNDNEENYYSKNGNSYINKSYINNYFDDVRERVLQESLSNELLLEDGEKSGSILDSIGSGLVSVGRAITWPFKQVFGGASTWAGRTLETEGKGGDLDSSTAIAITRAMKAEGAKAEDVAKQFGVEKNDIQKIIDQKLIGDDGKVLEGDKLNDAMASIGEVKVKLSRGLTGYLQQFGRWMGEKNDQNAKNLIYGGVAVGGILAGFYLLKKYLNRKDKKQPPTQNEIRTAEALASGKIDPSSREFRAAAQQAEQYKQAQQHAA